MTDETEMPFGKWKGLKLKDVPAKYLLWLWDGGVWQEPDHRLHSYIKGVLSSLESDATDYILQHPVK